MKDCQRADRGAVALVEPIFAVGWKTYDLDRDVWLVVDDGGRVVGAAMLGSHPDPTQMNAAVNVHPEHRGHGIENELDQLIDERAREVTTGLPQDRRVVVHQRVGHLNEEAPKRLASNGYAFVRRMWEMAIELGSEMKPVVWPSDIRVTALEPGTERAVLDAANEAFRDHWGFVPIPYEQFMEVTAGPGMDRSLSVVAWSGSDVAGCSLNLVRNDGAGFVASLSVRRPWRRHGLGFALLTQSFNEFRRRGLERAALAVDSENLTGATRLYERAGMHVVRHADTYEKTLREGSPSPV